jgi:hypothetical protein
MHKKIFSIISRVFVLLFFIFSLFLFVDSFTKKDYTLLKRSDQFLKSQIVEVDGEKFSEFEIIKAALEDTVNVDVIKNYSVAHAEYISYDKKKKEKNCAYTDKEAKNMLVDSLINLNIPQVRKDQAQDYLISKIIRDYRFFEFSLEDEFSSYTYRIHNCSYIYFNDNYLYVQKPITQELVKDMAYYLWGLSKFGFPHFLRGKSVEDDNYFYYHIYFAEPHESYYLDQRSGCDYAELVKKTIKVNKDSGLIEGDLNYPKVFVETGKCW